MRPLMKFFGAFGCLVAAVSSAPAQATTYTYAGSWIVGNGPAWYSSPTAYTGQSAAALLFGGIASTYVTSTISSAIADINFMAFYDGYGTGSSPTARPDDFSTSNINGGTYSGSGSYSTYVLDNTCDNRYDDLAQTCVGSGTRFVNYAFRVADAAAVPEPVSAALLGAGLISLAAVRRRRS